MFTFSTFLWEPWNSRNLDFESWKSKCKSVKTYIQSCCCVDFYITALANCNLYVLMTIQLLKKSIFLVNHFVWKKVYIPVLVLTQVCEGLRVGDSLCQNTFCSSLTVPTHNVTLRCSPKIKYTMIGSSNVQPLFNGTMVRA